MGFLILSIAIQAGLIIHVIKTGRNQIWIWVLALLSYAGIVAYVAVEIIPDLFRSRTAQRTARGFKKAMDPTADLRRFEDEARVGSNVAARQRYAEELSRHGQHDEAIAQIRRTFELDPNYPVANWVLGLVLRGMGRYEEAISEGEKGVRSSGGSPLIRASLAQSLGAAGKAKEAREILDELTSLGKQKYVAPYFFAGIYAGLGDEKRAMEYLERAYEEHSHWMIYLHMDPGMDSLRSDPRFQDLLRRVGLPLQSAGASPS